MNLLAVDTATEACSAALIAGENRYARRRIAPREHSRLLLPMMESLLAEAGMSWGGLDGLAYGRGPGSFTGLRIAAGVIQGLALSLNKPVIPVSVLASLAYRVFRQTAAGYTGVVTDARMGEVYWAVYQRGVDAGPVVVEEEAVCLPGDVVFPTAMNGERWAAIGSGWPRYPEVLQARCPGPATWHMEDQLPHAADMAELAAVAFQKGYTVTEEETLPVYIRNQVAEKKKDEYSTG